MDRNEAVLALSGVKRTQHVLAEHARWPLVRHAMFGLAEGWLVAAAAQPFNKALVIGAALIGLLVLCVAYDRRSHGMFVSGWRNGATLPLTILLTVFASGMILASFLVHHSDHAEALGSVFGAIAFVVCTAGSVRWEQLFRAELTGEPDR